VTTRNDHFNIGSYAFLSPLCIYVSLIALNSK